MTDRPVRSPSRARGRWAPGSWWCRRRWRPRCGWPCRTPCGSPRRPQGRSQKKCWQIVGGSSGNQAWQQETHTNDKGYDGSDEENSLYLYHLPSPRLIPSPTTGEFRTPTPRLKPYPMAVSNKFGTTIPMDYHHVPYRSGHESQGVAKTLRHSQIEGVHKWGVPQK